MGKQTDNGETSDTTKSILPTTTQVEYDAKLREITERLGTLEHSPPPRRSKRSGKRRKYFYSSGESEDEQAPPPPPENMHSFEHMFETSEDETQAPPTTRTTAFGNAPLTPTKARMRLNRHLTRTVTGLGKAMDESATTQKPVGLDENTRKSLNNLTQGLAVNASLTSSLKPDYAQCPRLPSQPASYNSFKLAMKELDVYIRQPVKNKTADILHFLERLKSAATSHQLNTKQYFDLAATKVLPGSLIYEELEANRRYGGSAQTFYAAIIPLFKPNNNVNVCQAQLNEYRPAHNATPQEVMIQVKSLVRCIHKAENIPDMDKDLVQRISDKISQLYPLTYAKVMEDERYCHERSLEAFIEAFTKHAPLYKRSTKHAVHALTDEDVYPLDDDTQARRPATTPQPSYIYQVSDHPAAHTYRPAPAPQVVTSSTPHNTSDPDAMKSSNTERTSRNLSKPVKTPHIPGRTMQITQIQMQQLKDKCYRCGNWSTGTYHPSKECPAYKDKEMAFTVCNVCHTGVHLPKDCLHHIHEQQVLYISTEDVEPQGNEE